MRYIFWCLIATLITLSASNAGDKNIFKAEIDRDGIQRVELLAGKYFFNPDRIVVKVNVPVEIKVRKEAGIIPHSFVIKEPDAGMDINESIGSKFKVMKFVPLRVGKYAFYCEKKLLFFKSHREDGMEGILEVTE